MRRTPVRMLVALVGAAALPARCGTAGRSAPATTTAVTATEPAPVRPIAATDVADTAAGAVAHRDRGGPPRPAHHGSGRIHGRLATGVRRRPGFLFQDMSSFLPAVERLLG